MSAPGLDRAEIDVMMAMAVAELEARWPCTCQEGKHSCQCGSGEKPPTEEEDR